MVEMEQTNLFKNDRRGAIMNDDRSHRFVLWRHWNTFEMPGKPYLGFIGLNPSRANDVNDDPTIKRVIAIARRNGYGGIMMFNLYSMVTPYPKEIVEALINSRYSNFFNGYWIDKYADQCKDIVFCWGDFKVAKVMASFMIPKFPGALCLAINKNGSPKHPLYCRTDSPLIPFKQ